MELFLFYMPLLLSIDLGDLKSAVDSFENKFFYFSIKLNPHLKSI